MHCRSFPVDHRIPCIDLVRRSLHRDSRRDRRLYRGSCLLLRARRRFQGNLRIPQLLLLVLAGSVGSRGVPYVDCVLLQAVWVRYWQRGIGHRRARHQRWIAVMKKAYTSRSLVCSIGSLFVAIVWGSSISRRCLLQWDLLQ